MNDKLEMISAPVQTQFERRFVLDDLPAPLTRASFHLQFFDNYITNTRLFLQRVRNPATKQWTRKLMQKYALSATDLSHYAAAEIGLSAAEYEVLSVFEANELRYNRYFWQQENCNLMIDMYLNRELWNLVLATVQFDTRERMQAFALPSFVKSEITHDKSFVGINLSNLSLSEIQKNLVKD